MKKKKVVLLPLLSGLFIVEAEGTNVNRATRELFYSQQNKMKNKKRDSIAMLPLISHEQQENLQPASMSIQDYFNILDKFDKANGTKISETMKTQYNEMIKQLCIFGDIFGYERYHIPEEQGKVQPDVIFIDISYPNLLNAVRRFLLDLKNIDLENYDEENPMGQKPQTVGHLKWILNRFQCVENGDAQLNDEQIDQLVALTSGIDDGKTFCVNKVHLLMIVNLWSGLLQKAQDQSSREITGRFNFIWPRKTPAQKALKQFPSELERKFNIKLSMLPKEKLENWNNILQTASVNDNLSDNDCKIIADILNETVSTNNLNQFRGILRQTLKNKTGAQRVMSLLILNMCNQIGLRIFNQKNSYVTITFDKSASSCYYPDSRTININNKLGGEDNTLNHEMTHAYHYLIGYGSIDNDLSALSWMFNFSAINSLHIDLLDEYFPMLKRENMLPILDSITNLINNSSKKKWSDIKDLLITDTNNKVPVKSLIDQVMMNGFGSMLFKPECPVDFMTYEHLINDSKLLPILIYLCVFSFNSQKSSNDSVWGDYDERLTMRGNNVFLLDGRYFVVSNRQNEHIFTVRKHNEHGLINSGSYHRYHTTNAPQYCFKILKQLMNIFSDKKTSIMNFLSMLNKRGLTIELAQNFYNTQNWTPSYIKYDIANKDHDSTNDDEQNTSDENIEEPKYLERKAPIYNFNKPSDRRRFLKDIKNNRIDTKDINTLTFIGEISPSENYQKIPTNQDIVCSLIKDKISITSFGLPIQKLAEIYACLKPYKIDNSFILAELSKLQELYSSQTNSHDFHQCVFYILRALDFSKLCETEEERINALVKDFPRVNQITMEHIKLPNQNVDEKKIKLLLSICESVANEFSITRKDYTWQMQIPFLETFSKEEVLQFLDSNEQNFRTSDYNTALYQISNRSDKDAKMIRSLLPNCRSISEDVAIAILRYAYNETAFNISNDEIVHIVDITPIDKLHKLVQCFPNKVFLLETILKACYEKTKNKKLAHIARKTAFKSLIASKPANFTAEIKKIIPNIFDGHRIEGLPFYSYFNQKQLDYKTVELLLPFCWQLNFSTKEPKKDGTERVKQYLIENNIPMSPKIQISLINTFTEEQVKEFLIQNEDKLNSDDYVCILLQSAERPEIAKNVLQCFERKVHDIPLNIFFKIFPIISKYTDQGDISTDILDKVRLITLDNTDFGNISFADFKENSVFKKIFLELIQRCKVQQIEIPYKAYEVARILDIRTWSI